MTNSFDSKPTYKEIWFAVKWVSNNKEQKMLKLKHLLSVSSPLQFPPPPYNCIVQQTQIMIRGIITFSIRGYNLATILLC